jgi:RimJ/RimL family protein N-acetyltransferase
MQEDFYRDVACNRNSPHRYWGIYAEIPHATTYSFIDELKSWTDGMPKDKVTLKTYSKFIGMGGLTNIEWENRQAEISLIINPALQKEGHGKEAVRLLLDQGFNHLNLDLVYGECFECGAIAFWQSIVKRYSAKTRWLRKGKVMNGQRHRTMYFEIDDEDFRKADNPV